jgi:hypothetical protein
VIQATGFAEVRPDEPPAGNTFSRNVLMRSSNWNNFLSISLSTQIDISALINANSWSGNVLHCFDQCSDSQIVVRLPGPNQIGGTPNIDPRAAEFRVPFAEDMIADDFRFLTNDTEGSVGFAAVQR